MAWYTLLWALVDERLREWSRKLQQLVRLLRLARVLLVVGILAVLASALVGLLWPAWFPIAYAVAVVFLVVPLVLCLFLVSAPLRAQGLIRLIERGYPGNAKEAFLRVAARKLHDESIETEELLLETAINEGRKVLRRLRRDPEPEEGEAGDGSEAPPAPPSGAGAPPF
jgi:hypothetical protein